MEFETIFEPQIEARFRSQVSVGEAGGPLQHLMPNGAQAKKSVTIGPTFTPVEEYAGDTEDAVV